MASTSAVLYVRPRLLGVTVSEHSTAAVLFVALRNVTGIFSAGGGFDNTSEASIKAWLPPPRVAVVDTKSGLMTPEWYRFFRYIAEDRLGGASAPSIGDVENTVTAAQSAVTQNIVAISAVTEAVNTNAQSLQTTIQVAQQNSLAGANQIPAPIQFKNPDAYL